MELRQVEVTKQVPSYERKKDNNGKLLPLETVMGSFHCWEHYKSEDDAYVRAIVELEDGSIGRFSPQEIKFTGKPAGANMFEEGELTPE